jgi:hypothetical protein
MQNPSRRGFFRSAFGATVASALPLHKPSSLKTGLSLVIDLIGPMAFKGGVNVFDVWMPKLDGTGKEHEAGIGTPVTSIVLLQNDYTITGPTPFAGSTPVHYTSGCQVYSCKPNDYSAANRYIRLTLPKPNSIVALNPVCAAIYPTGSTPSSYALYAVGLRFRYNKANTPNLSTFGDIPFDPGPDETELNMSIGYAPYVYDNTEMEAMYSFNQLSKLFPNLDLQVDIDTSGKKCISTATKMPATGTLKSQRVGGPLHNCKAPVILLE